MGKLRISVTNIEGGGEEGTLTVCLRSLRTHQTLPKPEKGN